MASQKLLVSPYEIADLAFVKAITNLHPGVGRTGETVDLPVQKDNLGFPIIYSSSLKGSLKSTFWNLDKGLSRVFFGSEPEDDEKFTSAIAILDAFTLAFPVRSLEGVYAFVTSPLLLHRFNEYAKIANMNLNYVNELLNLLLDDNECYVSQKAKELLMLKAENMNNNILINEEIEVRLKVDDKIRQLENLLKIEEGRLILLNDDNALRAMERSLVRVTRIRINREKKTVEEGGLWTEEYIPWGTIFVTAILYSKSKYDKKEGLSGSASGKIEQLQNSALKVREEFYRLLDMVRRYLIIGGNETVGKGIVELEFIS